MFNPVPPKPDFPAQERDILRWWKETGAFDHLRALRRGGPPFSFLDGPITANNPMGVHHAWGRTYKDLWQRYKAMRGYDQRWQNGFDCQGLWVEVNVEKDLGFRTKKDIEAYGLAQFVILCKQRVLNYAAVQTEQSVRLGMWMDWNDPDTLRLLRDRLSEDPQAVLTLQGPEGPVTGTVEQLVGQLGLPALGGSYFTFSDKNNYDIWRFLKACAERGWIYKGTDVMPWCWRCGTGISQHEIVTEGYVEKQDPGLTVRFPLLGDDGRLTGEALLVWTTTPWTLTSNVAAAVGPELTYLKVRTPRGDGHEVLYLSKGATHMLLGPYEVLAELPGRELAGWRYAGPFDDLPAAQHPGGWAEPGLRRLFSGIPESAAQAHRVVLWDAVGEAEGTGIVHIAPGCGAEDYQLHKEHHLPVVAPLDENGVYLDGFGWLTGRHVAGVTDAIVEALRANGRFYRLDAYTHRYPQCWRCGTPLVFRLVDEWFISMDGLRQPLMDVTNQIRWVPEFGRDRELDWLRNMHDWMISKKRYWGLALPIWECAQCGEFEVLGSRTELEARAVEGWETFSGHTPHRPYIDAVKIACRKCGGRAQRIADVGNPWLDAGIVSLSTLRYETDPDYWRKWFPADFITESFPGQFRNWFYSLLVMATALEGQPPTRTVLGFATLLGEDGRPMHKSWGNAWEFNEAADSPKFGADVMRWMYAGQRYEADLLFGEKHAEEARRSLFLPLWNVYNFFVTYANLDGWTPARGAAEPSQLDRWILARLQELVGEVTAALEDYYAYKATRPVEQFLDDLSNWYVRRSRRRFWKSEADADKQAAYSTLHQVLVTLAKLLAPFIPFTTEALYQNLVRTADPNAPLSVHHCAWPAADRALVDSALLADMATARTVVALGHATRASHNLKVRQPLARAVVVVAPEQQAGLLRMKALVADELNVKTVALAANEGELITYKLLPNNRLLGPRFGARFPRVRAALEAADASAAVAALRGGQPLRLDLDGETVALAADDVLINPLPRTGFAVSVEGGVVVALDTSLTPDLRAEGLARELVRRIQDLRKTSGFDIADRIVTYYTGTPGLVDALTAFAPYIQAETLSVDLLAGEAPAGAVTAADSIDDERVTLALVKAQPAVEPEQDDRPGARGDREGEAMARLIATQLGDKVLVAPGLSEPAPREAAAHPPRPSAGRGAGKRASKKAAKGKTAKKAAAHKSAAKGQTARKAAARKAAKKATAKKAAAAGAKKTGTRKAGARKAAPKQPIPKNPPAAKKTARKAARKTAKTPAARRRRSSK
ncbi:MAG: isoleucine--tRNA ligase [Anaerolineales bacterium]|nr:isoleucine--tRNA ligase [Anaerolineales bacterium]